MYLVDRITRLLASAILGIGVLAGAEALPAFAQQPPTVSAFLANPNQLLQQFPVGGAVMISAVEQLALADPATFKALIGLVGNANDQQKAAIGEALTQAAKIEVLTNQTIAADWQQQIAGISDPSFKVAATNALGDVQLGSIGGGNLGSSGGGSTGPGGGGGGGPTTFPQNNTNTPGFTFTGSTAGGPGVSFSTSP